MRAATLTSLEATTTSGDLRIAGQFRGPGPFSIVTVSGDALLAPAGDLRIEMATLSGDLHSELGGQPAERSGATLPLGRDRRPAGQRPLAVRRSQRRPADPRARTPPGSDAPAAAPRGPAPAPAPAAASPGAAPAARPADSPVRAPAPTAPVDAPTATNGALAAAYDEARLRILRSLERGEIDVAEAGRRLETLEGGEPDPSADTTRVSTVATPDA